MLSAEATGWVYRYSPFDGVTFSVHLAIADSANDQHGYRFWMATANLATKARCSRRSAVAALTALVDAGYLERLDDPGTAARAGRPAEYRFVFVDTADVAYDTRGGAQPLRTPVGNDCAGVSNHCAGGEQPLRTNPIEPKRSQPRAARRRSDPRADPLTREWWEAQDPRPLGKQTFVAVRQIVSDALAKGWSDDELRVALRACGAQVAGWKLDQELRKARQAHERRNPANDRWWEEGERDAG